MRFRPLLAAALAAAGAAAGLPLAATADGPYPMPTTDLNAVGIAGFTVPRVTSFGDSYSRLNRSVRDPATGRYVRVRNWLEQADLDGYTGAPAAYGVSGASAANVPVYPGKPVNSFAQQVQRWSDNGRQLGPREATAVYLGANDVNAIQNLPTVASLQRSKNDYSAAVKKLLGFGAASGDRRTFLFLIHDWGRNPSKNGDPGLVYRQRTQSWNSFVSYFARGRPNVVTVDLYTTFNKVFADPGAFGLSNVRTVDVARSASTALYADADHFGEKGQDIVEQVFLHYAARSWGWRRAAEVGARTAARIGREVDRAIAAAAPDRAAGDAGPGRLRAFAVGEAGAAAAVEERPAVDGDPTRAGFERAFDPEERPDGGFGVSYALSPGRSVGVVIGRYRDRVADAYQRNTGSSEVAADAVSVYLDQRLRGGLDLRTRLTVADQASASAEHDGLIDATSRARFGGRTTELVQRAGYPVEVGSGAALLTPWLELTHRRQKTDSYTVESPYLSDETYSASEAGETLAGVGLDAALAPVALGGKATLRLRGGVGYSQSLRRDDQRVTISEAAGIGNDQEETIERGQSRQISLDLGGELALGERLAVAAGLGVSRDLDLGTERQVSVRLSYRF